MRREKSNPRRRRAARGRAIIVRGGRNRLVAHRSGRHIYAQLLAPDQRVLASASSVEKQMRARFSCGGNRQVAEEVGKLLAAKVKAAGLPMQAAFDRGGYAYHGRVRALADGARAGGMEF